MPVIPDSILDTTKKALGIDPENPSFDIDIIMHINSVFAILQQHGVGDQTNGFEITDNTATWADYLGANPHLNMVRSYMYTRVRLLFDPPATSFDLTAKQEVIRELGWRLTAAIEQRLTSTGFPYGGGYIWTLDGVGDFPDDAPYGAVGIRPDGFYELKQFV